MSDAGAAEVATEQGTALYCDISGFTALTERLSQAGRIGAEQIAEIVDGAVGVLLDDALALGGRLLAFGGDALLLWFTGESHVRRATAAAATMRASLRRGPPRERVRMSFALHTDAFDFVFAGPGIDRLLCGPAVDALLAVDAVARADDVTLSRTCAAELPPSWVAPVGDVWRLRRGPPARRADSSSQADQAGVASEHGAAFHHVAVSFVCVTGVQEAGAGAVARAVACIDASLARFDVEFHAFDVSVDGFKVIAVAGAPRPQEENEARLVAAAEQIVAEVRELGLGARAGIDAGVVLAGTVGNSAVRVYSVFGDAVNTAARVMAGASDAEVLVTASVAERCRRAFATAPHEPLTAKGKAHPVAVARVSGARHRVDHDERGPLIGRERELRRLRDGLTHAERGSGLSVRLWGPAGIGKTRLIAEACADFAGDVVATEAASHRRHVPYAVVRGLVGQLPRVPKTLEEWPAWFAGEGRAVAPWADVLQLLLGGEATHAMTGTPGASSAVTQQALRGIEALFVHALPGAALIVVDDVAWADESSLAALERIESIADRHGWMVLTSSREHPGVDDAIEVPPIDEVAAHELVRAVAVEPLLPTEQHALVARAGGNPLFLTELTRTHGTVEVAETIELLLATEIGALHSLDRQILELVAVAGPTAFRAVVEAIAVQEGDRTAATRWVRLTPFVTIDDDGMVRFRHPLAREVAYLGMPHRTRARLHAAVGRALAERDDVDDALLSFHAEMSGDLDATWRLASRAWEAAQRAGAFEEVIVLAERALRAARRLENVAPSEVAELHLQLGSSLMITGRSDEALRVWRRIRQITDDLYARARARINEALLVSTTGSVTAAIRGLARAERELAALPPTADTARWVRAAKNYKAWAYFRQGRPQRARDQALELLDRAAADEAWVDVAFAHLLLANTAPLRERRAHAVASYDLFLCFGTASDRAVAEGNWSAALAQEGRVLEAIESGTRALAELDSLGRMLEWAIMRGNLADLRYEIGQFREALDEALDALDVVRRTGQLLYETYYAGLAARAAWALGDGELAQLWSKRALEACSRSPEHLPFAEVEAALIAEAYEEALVAYERHFAGSAGNAGGTVGYRGAALWRLGDHADAIALFDGADAWADVDPFARAKCRFVAASLRARLGTASDLADAARAVAAFGVEKVAVLGLDVFDVAGATTD